MPLTRIDAARPAGMPPAEWRARVDLAAAYRLAARTGWDDLVYTHLSRRLPGRDDAFLINPFGLAFDEITAGNLLVEIPREHWATGGRLWSEAGE